VETSIEKLRNLQEVIFAPTLERVALLSWGDFPHNSQVIRIHVLRNHAFEQIETVIAPFLALSELDCQFSYSGYDDTLSSVHSVPDCDLVLVWLDLARYAEGESREYIQNQLAMLGQLTSAPVVFLPLGGQLKDVPRGIHVYSFSHLELRLGDQFWDPRGELMSGTRLSLKATTEVAREIGLRVIPALKVPPIKSLVVDLDNTLYDGVLGEDGKDGVLLSEYHVSLQRSLKRLSDAGVPVSIVTKNDQSDVEDLFKSRTDFPLNLSDFFQVKASWRKKSEAIKEIHLLTNTHPESTVFMDDNLAEHMEVSSVVPGIRNLIAPLAAPRAGEILEWYPGIFSFALNSYDDTLRTNDLRANVARQKLVENQNPKELYKELEVELEFRINISEDTNRVLSLLNKTNQFIFSYLRPTEAEFMNKWASNKSRAVIAVRLRDRLSDSGIVAAVLLSQSKKGWSLNEAVISCRALGRELEAPLLIGAIKEFLYAQTGGGLLESVRFTEGPRNIPAQMFYQEWFQDLDEQKILGYSFPQGIDTQMYTVPEGGKS
jgi:FkbH-like protein